MRDVRESCRCPRPRPAEPRNIGVTMDGDLMIFDFGLASIWRIDETAGNDEKRALTFCGSLRYMAPEMVSTKQYNHKVDVFAFASGTPQL